MNWKEKAINIKGKLYVPVHQRIIYFNENYPDGSIKLEILCDVDDKIVVKASVFPDAKGSRVFEGLAEEIRGSSYINKTSALENASTSAIGRALGSMGIGIIDGLASADEVKNSERQQVQPAPPKKVSTSDKKKLMTIGLKAGWTKDEMANEIKLLWGELNSKNYGQAIKHFNKPKETPPFSTEPSQNKVIDVEHRERSGSDQENASQGKYGDLPDENYTPDP